MSDNLTIGALNRIVSLIPEGSDIIGFKIHPADLHYLAEQMKVSYSEATRYVIPSYGGGLSLYPDLSIPRGLVEPVRVNKSTPS